MVLDIMDSEKDVLDVEKTQAVGAGERRTFIEELSGQHSLTLPQASTNSFESRNSNNSDLSQEEQLEARREEEDLEELATVSSGPAYSAFSLWQKRYIVSMVTIAAFVSPTSASIYFPALNALAADLNVSNTLINLTVTSFMIFQGLAPTLFGDFADMAGRRPAYIVAFVIYIGANIGLALQNSYAALFLLRCLQSTGSSAAIALGFGVVADIASTAERGTYMGIVGAGIMLGPTISPVIGGILAQFLGWRAIFWFLAILVGVWLVPYVLTVSETGKNIVGNGSIPPQGWNMTLIDYLRFRKAEQEAAAHPGLSRSATSEGRRLAQSELAKKRKLRFPNPLKTIVIIMEKDVAMVLIYTALIYTAFYDVVASTPALFLEIYGFNDLQIGLCYIPFGAGCAISSVLNGIMMDRNYKRVAKSINFTIDRKHGDDLRHFPIERARIDLIWPLLSVGLAALLCYGWVLEKNANLTWALILQFIIGLCVTGSSNILGTLLVDLYPQSPATVTAANNLVRCLMGAGGTGVINIMIAKMGRGWCFTFISLVCVVGMPMLLVSVKLGPKWREERMVRVDKQKEVQKVKEADEKEHEASQVVQRDAEKQSVSTITHR